MCTRTTRGLTSGDGPVEDAGDDQSPEVEPVVVVGTVGTQEAIAARRARRQEATWDALVAAVGCATVAVVTIRLGMTGRPA